MSTLKELITEDFHVREELKKVKTKLPSKFKQKWLAALRSGKYKQGSGQLIFKEVGEKPTYCCLGVAAEIEGCKIGKNSTFLLSPTKYATIPKGIRGKHGLAYVLAALNDEGISFKRIATYIEKNF